MQECNAAQAWLALGARLGSIIALAPVALAIIVLSPIVLSPIVLARIVLAPVVLARIVLAPVVLAIFVRPAIVLTAVLLAIFVLANIVLATIVLTVVGRIPLFGAAAVGISTGAMGPIGRRLAFLLRILLLPFLAALAPLIGARNEATLALDDAEVMIGILPIGFCLDAVAHGCGFSSQRLILVVDLMRVAAHTDIRTTAVENLIPVWRPVRIVVVLLLVLIVIAAAAAAIAAAARTLTIVWSH